MSDANGRPPIRKYITLLGGAKAIATWWEGADHGGISVGANEGVHDQRFRAVAIARATEASGGMIEDWEITS